MQFRFPTKLTAEEYVQAEAWKMISISSCPIHPDSDCAFSRHGTYVRVIPDGTKIVRFLCHTEKVTFSLLPDCFSSRLPGTLVDLEAVVLMVETALCDAGCETPQAMEDIMFSEIDPAAAAGISGVDQHLFDQATDFRWLKRRVEYVLIALSVIAGLFPETFGNCRPTLTGFRSVLGGGPALVRLRGFAEPKIHEIPFPVGLNPRFSRPQGIALKPP